WRALTPNVSIVEKDSQEQIFSKTPFQEASFEFDSYYESTPKDYEFFQAFSDTSIVMYTGHLNACPDNIECNRPVEFKLIPRSNERGIILGKVFTTATNWIDETRRGTYVYFGHINPIETKYLTAIIDPKLPKWLLEKFNSLLPKLFTYYANRTGQPLTWKPFVFLNYIPDGEGNNSHGGTLPGIIQLSLKGTGWNNPDNESFIDLAKFLAHESAHIWNGQLFPYASGDMWMHEGGADAFAYFALYELKFINQKRFLDFQTEAFNYCLSNINNRPLMEVKEDPNFRSHYRCGSMLALITHSALLKYNKKYDLFYFWNQLFEEVKNSKNPYTEDLYFAFLDRIVQNNELSMTMKTLLRGPLKSAKDIYLNLFNQVNVKVISSEKNLPRDYNKRVGRDILRLLMVKDCGGKYGLSGGNDGIQTDGFDSCSTLKTAYYITHINQIPIVSSGAKAYDEVKKVCLTKESKIFLTARKMEKKLLVNCPDNIPARESFFQITKVPFKD
ncbi:MAG: hypothetical protein Q7U04_13755, partial [Bacteriovorax sp.]|nr:hypothetical protein [Bacteriovorax sp.]